MLFKSEFLHWTYKETFERKVSTSQFFFIICFRFDLLFLCWIMDFFFNTKENLLDWITSTRSIPISFAIYHSLSLVSVVEPLAVLGMAYLSYLSAELFISLASSGKRIECDWLILAGLPYDPQIPLLLFHTIHTIKP